VNEPHPIKTVVWIGLSRSALRSFPAEVKDVIGFALYQAQLGRKSPTAKPLTGFGGASVLEIVDHYHGDTYRGVYTVKFAEVVYVLHAFQKKAKKGVATPKTDVDLVKKRLKIAEDDYRLRQSERHDR